MTYIQAPLLQVNSKKKMWGLIIGTVALVMITVALIIYQLSDNDSPGISDQTEQVANLSEVDSPTPTPTSTLSSPGDSRVILKEELAVLAGPGAAAQVLYYLQAGANVQLIGRDRSGAWWQIRTSQGDGWLEAAPGSTEVTDLSSVPIITIPTPTSPSPETATPTVISTSTPTDIPLPPTATRAPSPTPTATDTPLPTPTSTVSTTLPPPTDTPAPIPTSGLTSIELLAPQLVEYNGVSFSWKWEDQSRVEAVDWYFDIKIFRTVSAGEPYNVLVAEPEQTRYTNSLWSFDGAPTFECGSYWVVQIAQRHPDGSYAGPLSAESERRPIGAACGSSGGGGDGGNSGSPPGID